MRLFVAVHPGERFQRELSRRLDGWRARLPLAGEMTSKKPGAPGISDS